MSSHDFCKALNQISSTQERFYKNTELTQILTAIGELEQRLSDEILKKNYEVNIQQFNQEI